MTLRARIARFWARSVLVAPLLSLTVVACAAGDEDGAPEDVVASEDALTGTAAAGSMYTTTARVNLRKGPSTSDEILLTIPKGASVKVVDPSPRSGFYHVNYDGNDGVSKCEGTKTETQTSNPRQDCKNYDGWAYGAYLKGTATTPPADTGKGETGQSDTGQSETPVTGTFNGKKYSGATVLWQGDWSFLVKCDSYSRGKGHVVFFCDESPSQSFVDDGAWIAVPDASFSKSLCGKSARVCKGDSCIVAKVVERSVTAGMWEGSTAVMNTLGEQTGFSKCTNSFGTATGVTITMQ
jgi:hypothetical protein